MFDNSLREPVFELPGGLPLGDGRRLEQVCLRPLSGHEEDWLAHHGNAPAAVAVSALLDGCVLPVRELPDEGRLARRLLAGDRDFLILQLRRLTLGDQVHAVLDCPSCQNKIDVTFDAAAFPVEKSPQPVQSEYAAGPRAIRFRLPSGEDQEAVAGLAVDAAADALLSRCLLDPSVLPLTPGEQREIIEEMERLSPKVELELDIHCPECGCAYVTPFDMTAFFFQEVRLKRERFLREVHTLALYYHWSEADILRLPRPRRRAYLELLSEATREQ